MGKKDFLKRIAKISILLELILISTFFLKDSFGYFYYFNIIIVFIGIVSLIRFNSSIIKFNSKKYPNIPYIFPVLFFIQIALFIFNMYFPLDFGVFHPIFLMPILIFGVSAYYLWKLK